MRTIFTLGLGTMVTMVLAGCSGNFVVGSGGAGGTTTTSSSSSGSTTSSSSSGTTSSSSSGTTSSSSSSSSSSTSSSGGTCDPTTCPSSLGFGCCNGACLNLHNDIKNCGTCGKVCTGTHPYCDNGTCTDPPCQGAACTANQFCCGSMCCSAGQICCDVPGPVESGPRCQDPDPMTGTCDKGCIGCVCASPDTPIATPLGDRPIADLRVGDLVYTVDHDAIVALPILRTNRVPVHDHHVVRVRLDGGAILEISPRHPTADGRTFGDLRAGGTLDRFGIASAELVPYTHAFTYDILPAGSTHTYFAAGALIGTTLPH